MPTKQFAVRSATMLLAFCALASALAPGVASGQDYFVEWTPIPDEKATLDVPIVTRSGAVFGAHNGALIEAGGFRDTGGLVDTIRILEESIGDQSSNAWQTVEASLPEPRALGISASHELGLIAIGGIDGAAVLNDVTLIRWAGETRGVQLYSLPSLPVSTTNGSAAIVDDVLYVLAGDEELVGIYAFDLSGIATDSAGNPITDNGRVQMQSDAVGWQQLDTMPSEFGTAYVLVHQNNGRDDVLYVFGDPVRDGGSGAEVWQYDPHASGESWSRRKNVQIDGTPALLSRPVAVAFGQSHVLVLGQVPSGIADEAFGVQAMSYNAITDAWALYETRLPRVIDKGLGRAPFALTSWGDDIVVRVQSTNVSTEDSHLFKVNLGGNEAMFGWVNMSVLTVYLLAMVMVGVFFVFRNKDVDDYFRGGQHIPWWAAACSMYATMLSSLTYVAMPSLVYRTDWVIYVGIWMILAVTPVAVYVAMPFFRQIDATSAYEYLSKRFNMAVRLFASGLFTLFHVGRMGIVMALTALALAAVTPFDAWQCVLIMGVLCLIYCTMGGIEAVIWTDTIQTVVLLIGAILCFAFIVNGVDGGLSSVITVGMENNKFRLANLDFGPDSFTTVTLWVVVIGGLGQNLSTYTADQAVVQRYMTTKDKEAAARSIWANGFLAPMGSVLFFLIGTGLYVFYQSNPDKLDPTKQLDQIFPAFIATELPIGIAGLIIAGIFAAAQSTVSTSMNSIATTLVTDFMRPFDACRSEHGYLVAARWLTFTVGTLGTLAGLIFISPEIRSLMEEYFKVVGMFMGALGGLFVLGVISTRANGIGAMIGLLSGVGAMLLVWSLELADGYLFATIGIVTCLLVGYGASAAIRSDDEKSLSGLTIHTMSKGTA